MSDMQPALADAPTRAGNPRAHWPQALQEDFERGKMSGVVGSVLVSETDRVRVWHLSIAPGARCGFHRHVLHYFWTALTDGKARGYFEDGRITESTHFKGQTMHLDFGPGEYMVHSVENIGDTELQFTTVEFLDSSPNKPLPIPPDVRLS
jgi:quercetin dioxygenase-like cupin family protein